MSFVLSKIAWALLSPGGLLALILIAGVMMQTAHCPRAKKTGKILCLVVAISYLMIAILPVGQWALTPLENRFAFDPPEQVDGVIVIGGDEKPQIAEARNMPVVVLDSMRRYVTFLDMSRRYPDAKLIFSGGSPFSRHNAKIEDADVARENMADIGVPTSQMIFEKTSRTTYENAVFTADIVRPEPSQKWILVTSAWHMPRAMASFRHAGWNVYAAPTGYFTPGTYDLRSGFRFDDQMHMLTLATHEYVGLLAYWLMGRTDTLWPK